MTAFKGRIMKHRTINTLPQVKTIRSQDTCLQPVMDLMQRGRPRSFINGTSIVMGIAMILSSSCAQAFYNQHSQGWFWYQMPPVTPPEAQNNQQDMSSQQITAHEKIKKVQQEFEEATARAILSPTLANVQQVMTLQRQILNRASRFQEIWMQASLFEEQYKSRQESTHSQARLLIAQAQEQDLKTKIRKIAQQRGFFFAFSSDCTHCHAFAPVVKAFAGDYGFEVKAISKDGGTLKEFTDVSPDNGILARLNPQGVYPALYLAHPSTGQVIPVAWGMTTESELMQNFATIIKALEENTFHDR